VRRSFLAIAVGGRRGTPHLTNLGAKHLNAVELLGTESARPLLLSSPSFHLCSGKVA
jgi:hypothetical protein